jgi:Cold shock proteins|tara:strand:+ start:247 stop:456 length:210 start_codon:yes stop_codon:yes gene_type:complete
MNGTVKEYDKTKGFGFISGDDGEDYFVHVYGLGPKLRKFGLIQGQRVAFDIDFDMKGDKAINVRPGKQS